MSQTWSLLSTPVQYLLQPLSTSVFFYLLSFKTCSKALPAFGVALAITNFTLLPFFSLLFIFLRCKPSVCVPILETSSHNKCIEICPYMQGGKGFMGWRLAIPSLCVEHRQPCISFLLHIKLLLCCYFHPARATQYLHPCPVPPALVKALVVVHGIGDI